MPEIAVRGTAEARVEPTSATVTVTVRVGPVSAPTAAVEQAATDCAAVDQAIEAHRAELIIAAVDTSLRTGQDWDYSSGKGKRLLGYYATRSTGVECAPDGDGLTTLLSQLAAVPNTSISGPTWRIAPDAEGVTEVRTAAASDARARAGAYARGLGMRVGPVVWVAEPGLRQSGGGSGPSLTPSAPMARSARGGPPQADDEPRMVRVTPEPIQVQVTVEVGFELTQG